MSGEVSLYTKINQLKADLAALDTQTSGIIGELTRKIDKLTAERDALKEDKETRELYAKAVAQIKENRSDKAWLALIDSISRVVKCLPDITATGNEHIVRKIASIVAERDALLKENEWHPWDEYPDNHRNVLVRTDEDIITSGYWLADLQQWRSGNHGAVTHWRELPKFKDGK